MSRILPQIVFALLAFSDWAVAKSEGVDFEFGALGADAGQLSEVRDMVASHGNFYVLEGILLNRKTGEVSGNMRVQVFDPNGHSLRVIALSNKAPSSGTNPIALAVDSAGNVYVADNGLGRVDRYDADGKHVGQFDVKYVSAIVCKKMPAGEEIVVATDPPPPKGANKKGERAPVSELAVFSTSGDQKAPLKLSRSISGCTQLVADSSANLYAKAAVNQVYKFDQSGALVMYLGTGTAKRLDDSSELIQSIAVDSQQRIYGITPGNPGLVCRFEADGSKLVARRGQYAFADAWGYNTHLHFVIDESDRLWFASDSYPGRKVDPKKHLLPTVERLEKAFFDGPKNIAKIDTIGLGFNLSAEVKLPYNIGYELTETPVDLIMSAGMLRVHGVKLTYAVYDSWKNVVASGDKMLQLADSADTRQTISFTPPKWGWYGVVFDIRAGDKILSSGGCNLGFTPTSPEMPAMKDGESPGGWADGTRQMFVGMPLIRLHPAEKLDQFDKQLVSAEKAGATIFAQFSDLKLCTPEFVSKVVTAYKDRIKYWEIMNEPNFSMTAEKYADLVKQIAPIIKRIDPQAKVMGADHCGIDLDWYRIFCKQGGAKDLDILSVHDYEGHESMDQFHWPWKYGELRKIMAEYGDQGKEIWQTERCFSGVRAHTFLGTAQAVRITLHQDILESIGVPTNHNHYYYVNQAGYIPVYLWSRIGPFPAAMATRTRYAMTIGRDFQGKYDFGETGNKTMLALPYKGKNGTTIICRNYGADDLPMTFALSGNEKDVELVDAFGNASRIPVTQGHATVISQSLPQYVRLPAGIDATAVPIDYGRNFASEATFTYSAPFTGELKSLSNEWFESPHGGDPRRGLYFQGEFNTSPQTLEIKLPAGRDLNHVVVYSLRADNAQSALLDYDVESFDGNKWTTVSQIRTPVPASIAAKVGEADAFQWYRDENFSVASFPSIHTDRLRLKILRTTFGLIPDEEAKTILKAPNWKSAVLIREIELYGPSNGIDVVAKLQKTSDTLAGGKLNASISITNQRDVAIHGSLELAVPVGYAIEPSIVHNIEINPNESKSVLCSITIPVDVIAERTPLSVKLSELGGTILDFDEIDISADAPALLTAKPMAIKDGKQIEPVEIKNLTTSLIAGHLKCVARSSETSATPVTVEQDFVVAIGKTTRVELPMPEIDAKKSNWVVDYTATLGHVTIQSHDVPLRSE